MKSQSPEWTKFKVGKPSSNPNCTEPTCRPLSSVYHVAHIETACDISRDSGLKAGLIFDKCKLNNQRVLVTWLSPNFWHKGFRYGNIRFEFDFQTLITGKNSYWVEDIAYEVPACRILITEKTHDKLDPYDPCVGDGPWWHNKAENKHYWNGKYCLEIMFEGGLSLQNCIATDFVCHMKDGCCNDFKKCPDREKIEEDSGAEFLSRIIGRRIDPKILKMTARDEDAIISSHALKKGARHLIYDGLGQAKPEGKVKYGNDEALPLARSILALYAHSPDEALVLCNMFASRIDLRDSCKEVLSTAFGLSDSTALY